MTLKWQKYLAAVLFILVVTWLLVLSNEIKYNSAHNHNKEYFLKYEVMDKLRFMRNDLAFEKNLPTHEVLRKVMYHLNLSIKDGNIFEIDGGTDYTKTKGWRGVVIVPTKTIRLP